MHLLRGDAARSNCSRSAVGRLFANDWKPLSSRAAITAESVDDRKAVNVIRVFSMPCQLMQALRPAPCSVARTCRIKPTSTRTTERTLRSTSSLLVLRPSRRQNQGRHNAAPDSERFVIGMSLFHSHYSGSDHIEVGLASSLPEESLCNLCAPLSPFR